MVTNNNPFANEIADFSDKRISEIIHDPDSYASVLVDGCRREAKDRNLNISDTFHLGNPFSEDVKKFSDAKLLDMLTSNVTYSAKLSEACQIESEKRGLEAHKIKDTSFNYRDDLIQVQQSLKNNVSVNSIKNHLKAKGYLAEDALLLIDKAIALKEIKVVHKEEKKSSGIGVFGVLFIIYVVIKWVYILSK